MPPPIVLDTNGLIAGLWSRRGASFQLLSLVGHDAFEIHLSVPLVFEYEATAKDHSRDLGLSHAEIDAVIDYLCAVGHHHEIFFLWRPFLRDPRDDMVLELAVEASATMIVTHNTRDFADVEQFGVEALSPGAFLRRIGVPK